jgi:hypothetical protein
MSDPILARQRAEAEKIRQKLEEDKATRQALSRRVAAAHRMEDLLGPFAGVVPPDTNYLTQCVEAIAEYKALLAERELLEDRLTQRPGHIDPDTWQMAVEIFRAADADPDRAVGMLMELTELPSPGFASAVADCLRQEIRSAAEGKAVVVVTPAELNSSTLTRQWSLLLSRYHRAKSRC